RLARQLVTEGAVLAAVGGVAGLALAVGGISALLALAPENIPRLDQIRIDARVLGFALGCTGICTLVLSLIPALQGAQRDLADALSTRGQGIDEGRSHRRLRDLLIVAEIALALPLLVGAGLMVNSFLRLSRVEPGFEPDQLLT